MLLAGDIGGTKTDLAVVSPQSGARAPLAETTVSSADYPNLEALVQEFLDQTNMRVERAVFGIPGPVAGGRATVTNLPWRVDEAQMAQALGISEVRLLNDLAATAYGVPHLEAADLHTLRAGRAIPEGTIAVIAPGTGLGEGFLTWNGSGYRAHSSEGGHTDFAPSTPRQIAFLEYLLRRFDHVSWERVCSGQGLPNIYAFLKEGGYAPEPAWLAEQLAEAADPTPIIIDAALDPKRGAALCLATVELFVSLLGAEAGDLALKVLATGGLYIAGGLVPRILPLLDEAAFLEAFQSKGRMSDLLSRVPVHVILNQKAALHGAAYFGLDLMK